MKKQYGILAAIVCMLVLLSVTVSAESPLQITNVTVDYETDTISVDCKTGVGYLQSVVAVIYKTDQSAPSWENKNYVRSASGVTDEDGKCTISFVFGRDMTATDYTVLVTGGGNATVMSKDSYDFKVIPLVQAGLRLASYNSATEAQLDMMLNEDAVALQIKIDSFYTENKEQYVKTMLSMRDVDCKSNGSSDLMDGFNNLTDVKEIYDKARALLLINQSTTPAQLHTALGNNAAMLGLDIDDTDYNAETADKVCAMLYALNNTDKAKNVTQFQKSFNQALAITMVNSSGIEGMKTVIQKYAAVLELNSTDLTSYTPMGQTDSYTVARELENKSFAAIKDVQDAFSRGVKIALEHPAASEGDVVHSGGGFSSGGGSGGFAGSGSVSAQTGNVSSYTDMNEFAWAEQAIKTLSAMGIVNGYENGSFGGNKPISRSEFIKMVVIAFGCYDSTATGNFSDVPKDAWYSSSIGSAVNNGLINGYPDGRFGVNDMISREDAAVVIWRVLQSVGIQPSKENAVGSFTDSDAISDYSKNAIRELQQYGIINGLGDGRYGPKLPMTRAQVAKMIFELLQKIEKI